MGHSSWHVEEVAVGELKGWVACAPLAPSPFSESGLSGWVTVHGGYDGWFAVLFLFLTYPVTPCVSVPADPDGVRALFGSTPGLWPGWLLRLVLPSSLSHILAGASHFLSSQFFPMKCNRWSHPDEEGQWHPLFCFSGC